MRRRVAVFLAAVIVVSLIGVTISVIGVSSAVLAKDFTKATSHNYKQGWGRCSVRWCNCQAFEGYGDLCQNCGHQYTDHW